MSGSKAVRRTVAAIGAAALLGGCASINFTPRIEPIGKYRDTLALERRATEMRWADARDVEVFVGTFPEGVTLEGRQVKQAKDGPYEVVARVHTNPRDFGLSWLGFWGYDYPEDQSWRRGYCYWQVPLNWLTLGLWSVATPFYWTCRVFETDAVEDIAQRKHRIIATLKKATKAAGGTILVVTRLGKWSIIEGDRGPSSPTLDVVEAEGYALRRRRGGS